MSLQDAAAAVLTANWTGASTVPSRRQYPHQWGWDAAYIAIGWSWVDPARAAAELESLLRGQWADGRVPHIVFHPGVPEDAYFPGPAFWDSGVDGFSIHVPRTRVIDRPTVEGILGGLTGVTRWTPGLDRDPVGCRACAEARRRRPVRARDTARAAAPRRRPPTRNWRRRGHGCARRPAASRR